MTRPEDQPGWSWWGEDETRRVPDPARPTMPSPPVPPQPGLIPPGSTRPDAAPIFGQPPTAPRGGAHAAPPQPAPSQPIPAPTQSMPAGPVPPAVPFATAETAMIPRAAFYETALIPSVPVDAGAPPSMTTLARQYGLQPTGTRPSLGEYTRQLLAFREFITNYASGRQVAAYGEARLGRFWQVLTPVFNAAVYYFIFGVILKTNQGIPNFIGYLTIGYFTYNFTSQTLGAMVTSLSGQLGLVRAMQFPRASLPLATMWMMIQNFFISLVVMVALVFATGERPSVRWVEAIPVVVLATMFNTGLGLILARLGTRIHDVRQVVPFVTRVWMYLSGVFYPVAQYEKLPGILPTILNANPLLIYIELMRHAFLGTPAISATPLHLWAAGLIWAVAMVVVGYVYFWRGEAEYGRG